MIERLGAGAMARMVRQSASRPKQAEDYEKTLAPMYAWIHAIAQNAGPEFGSSSHDVSAQAWRALAGSRGTGPVAEVRRRLAGGAFPVAVAAINRLGIGPVRADLSVSQLRRASLEATGEVVRRLGVDARYVVFGHTHRAGPLARDDRSEWTVGPGTALINTGCWVHEPTFLGRDPARSPYRAGFAVRLEREGPPELVNLLDSLG
jgi:hypothetical protein